MSRANNALYCVPLITGRVYWRASRLGWVGCGQPGTVKSLHYLCSKPLFKTLVQNPCWKPLLETLVQNPCWKPLLETLVGNPCWKPLLETLVGNPCSKPLFKTLVQNPCSRLTLPVCLGHRRGQPGEPQTRWRSGVSDSNCSAINQSPLIGVV